MSTQFTNRQWRLPNNENKDKQSNYSMDFDTAANNGINCGTVPTMFIGDSSVSIWFKSEVINTSENVIFSRNQSGYGYTLNRYVLRTEHSGSGVKIKLELGTSGGDFYSQNVYSKSVWHHLVCTLSYSGGQYTVKFYVDGVEDSPTNSPMIKSVMTSNNTIPLIIGGLWNWNSTITQGCRGLLDGVSIFDYALTDGTGGTVNQIAALYGSSSTGIGNPMSLSPKPVAYYPLGDQDAFNGSNYLVPNSSLKDFVFNFDSSSSNYIDFNSINLGTTNTISFWHKRGATSNQYVLGSTDGTQKYIVYFTPNYIYIRPDGSTQFITTYLGNTPYPFPPYNNTTDWANYIITRSGDNIKLYLNGVEFALSGSGSGMAATTVNRIGTKGTSVSNTIDGELSNIQFFNTALPATGSNSVETLYNNGSPLTSMTGFTSLVSWWKLDASDTYDGTNWTIEDHAGSNDGTSSGMTQANLVQSDLSFTSGYSPYALDFDSASTDYISCGNDSSLNTNALTVSCWVKCDPFTPGVGPAIISKDVQSTSSPERSFGFLYVFSNFLFQNWDSAGNENRVTIAQASNPINTDGQWHHLVATIDGTTNANGIKVYIDNVVVGQATATATGIRTSIVPFVIGGSGSTGTDYNWDGQISNVSYWDAALTSAQVTEIYSEGIPQNLNNHSAVSSLVSWWQLGSNSSFNSSLNQWTCIDEKGTNTGESSQTFNEDAIVDGVGSYANGLGNSALEVVGDAPYSTANSLSVNMDVEDRVTDTPS